MIKQLLDDIRNLFPNGMVKVTTDLYYPKDKYCPYDVHRIIISNKEITKFSNLNHLIEYGESMNTFCKQLTEAIKIIKANPIIDLIQPSNFNEYFNVNFDNNYIYAEYSIHFKLNQ